MSILVKYNETGRKLTTEEVDGNWSKIEDRFNVIESPGVLLFKKTGNGNLKSIQIGDVRLGFLDSSSFGFQQWDGTDWVELNAMTIQ